MAPEVDPHSLSVVRSTRIRDALESLNNLGAGVLLLVNESGMLERTVTDGDLRRLILAGASMDQTLALLPAQRPVTLAPGWTRRDALETMNVHGVSQLPVVDIESRVVGLVDRRAIDDVIHLSAPHMGGSEREFVDDAFRTNWIAPLGPNVDQFEHEFAQALGIDHAAAVSSGTAALHLAMVLLGVGPGDRVICSSLTFVASVNPILYQGAEPIFVDSEPESWNMCPSALEAALEWCRCTGRPAKAVIVVNLYGQSADLDPIAECCRREGVPLVEDAAESLGSSYKGRPSGTTGDIAAFSFNGNKIITTSGGGMLVAKDGDLIRRARFLATQAREPARHYEHRHVGFNYRMSNILAGVGRGQLRSLSDRVDARRRVFERYQAALRDVPGVDWMPEPTWSRASRWLSVMTVDRLVTGTDAASVISFLLADLIEARPVWKPMHLQPLFAGAPHFTQAGLPYSERLFRDGVCLPSGSGMTGPQLERVVGALRRALGCSG
jgi:dTDP-4-amino-4,6-dideoxygalactose transaminase